MQRCKFVFLCALFVCLAGTALAQSLADTSVVSLTVDQGVSLQVRLTEKLRFKENEAVRATIIEPVYSFDREVIPAGTQVEGTITGFEKAGKWKRISSMLGGDFTPLRDPNITFHTLVFGDGTRISIETSVFAGTEKVGSEKSHGSDLKNSLISTVKKPGKEQLKDWLWGMAPYHPQYLQSGTRLNAVLLTPLDFGTEPPADSIVSARLLTPLDSKTAQVGASVDAELTRPLFSEDHKLIFPVGSKLQGKVTQVTKARTFHRNGQLGFTLTTIEPPLEWMSLQPPQEIKTSLVSVAVTHDMKDLRIKGENTAAIVESKKRFIAPAWAFIKAERSVNASEDSFGTAVLGAYRGKFLKRVTGAGPSSFGLPGSITGAMVPPVGMGLSFFGAARSAYSSFLGRGRDINLPDNTAIEIRLEKHATP
jgi:hypothetical protein